LTFAVVCCCVLVYLARHLLPHSLLAYLGRVHCLALAVFYRGPAAIWNFWKTQAAFDLAGANLLASVLTPAILNAILLLVDRSPARMY